MTINYSSLFSSTALGGGVLARRFFFSSQAWTVPVTGTYRIHLWGGSGTGGITRGQQGYTTGGGGGAKATKTVKLNAGDILIFNVGAGGAINQSAVNVVANGNDGGDTTVTGPGGLNVVAGGGKGGKASTALAALLGGLGGIATGGDENLPGGRGGNITAANASTVIGRATGGGGLPVVGPGRRGGDIASTFAFKLATGGAGAGGDGGDILSDGVAGETATGGGGSITSGISVLSGGYGATAGGKALLAIAVPGKIDVPLTPWFPYSGEGQTGIITSSGAGLPTDAGPGGGSGGAAATSTNGMLSRGPGIFGGSGGSVSGTGGTSQSGIFANGANPFVGGSGGSVHLTTGTASAAAGGDGWTIVERLS